MLNIPLIMVLLFFSVTCYQRARNGIRYPGSGSMLFAAPFHICLKC